MIAASAAVTGVEMTPGRLLDQFSLEMTARDIDALEQAAPLIPAGTRISVTFLPNEDFPARVAAAATVRRLGFVPVPHISARRLRSAAELEGFLESLAAATGMRDVFVVAGDPPQPEGPYEDALAVVRTGLLGRYGVRHVGISGYPEGHPDIDGGKLWRALLDKHEALTGQGLDYSIMTQFGFDADPILAWLEQVRGHDVSAPVRLGVAGPASVKTLLRFAARCGVGASAKVMAKYGLSLTRLLGSAGPDPIIRDLVEGLDPAVHGDVRLHFYPFGGFTKTAQWVRDFQAAQTR